MNNVIRLFAVLATLLTFSFITLSFSTFSAQHDHKSMKMPMKGNKSISCVSNEIKCAKTMTTAFAPNGDLWRVWSTNQQMFYQVSSDLGKTFSSTKRVMIAPEKISARNENRPKIAFDGQQGVYLSWAMSGEKRFTADVRFSYSLDNGQSFSKPITINNDGYIAGHSFNEMIVTEQGEVTIVWLDGRYSYEQRLAGKKVNGSELYLAKGNPRKNIAFDNQALARGTCVCCRISMDNDSKGNLAVFWRHIFGDNIREFALLTLDSKRPNLAQVKQISEDHWYIQGCPHQGGSVSIDKDNRYHLVWYNQGSKGKGIFYAYSDDAGKTKSTPLLIGDNERQAAHPNLKHTGDIVDIVWTEFNGKEHELWHQRSVDRGRTFALAKVISRSKTGADRAFILSNGTKSIVSWQRPNTGHWISPL